MSRKTGLNTQVIVTGRPKAVLLLQFHLFYFGVVQFINVLILPLLLVRFVWFSKDG